MGITDGSPARSLGEAGEFGLIAALASRLPAGPAATVGIGDDSAVIAVPSGSVVAAVDLLLEGRHFVRSWSSGFDVGVKAAARSLADIAAMGATATALLVGLAAPGSLPVSWALDFAAGLASECGRAGAGVVGGDTARADKVIVSVTALGTLTGDAGAVLRSGARPGDVVAVAGPLGYSAAGHALLSAGLAAGSVPPTGDASASGPAPRPGAGPFAALVAAHLRPSPLYDAGPQAARLGATSMIDISDGLVADLGHVAAASGVAIDIETPRLVTGGPLAGAARAVLAARPELSGTDPRSSPGPAVLPAGREGDPGGPGGGPPGLPLALTWVLAGGEDHSLVATFPPSAALPGRWRVIGSVRDGSGVTVDGARYTGPGGWQHFG